MLLSWWVAAIAALILLYLILRFNSLWIYLFFDRALRNSRTSLSPAYELPRYFQRDKSGGVNTEVRWPGWDGWYFFVIPRDNSGPAKMIRASVMTGLYGLDGVDDYSLVPSGVAPFKAVENLLLIPTEGAARAASNTSADGQTKQNYFAHCYLPKTDLEMKTYELDIEIYGSDPANPAGSRLRGGVRGKWPEYRFHFIGPGAGVEVELEFRSKNLVWWADLPGVFTYFSAFGEFSGTLSIRRNGTADESAETSQSFAIQGPGGFEHGFARKPFNYDLLYSPVRIAQKIAPGFRPIRYHYELLLADDGLRGGWMHARGFGINFRNRGGFYLNGEYVLIQGVDIEYSDPEPEQVPAPGKGGPRTTFYRRWQVRARTRNGILEYVAKREWPAAAVAPNMTYYNHSFEGVYGGKRIQGKGYGEYLNI